MSSSPRKLPVWRTVAAGYRSVFGDLRAFVARAWIWGLLAFAAAVGVGFLKAALGVTWLGVLAGAATMFAAVAFAVGWHRTVLLGEAATGLGGDRFGWREIRFLLLALLALFAACSPVIGGVLSFPLVEATAGAPAAVGLTHWTVIATFVVARFSLAFPMVAIDRPAGVIREAWRMRRGNSLRLMGGWFIAGLPFWVVSAALNRLLQGLSDRPDLLLFGIASGLLSMALVFAQAAVLAGFASHAYAELAGHSLPQPPSDDTDIWRAAKLMLDQHGADATFQAAMRADERLAAGDLGGLAVWKRIGAAIEALRRTTPDDGDALH